MLVIAGTARVRPDRRAQALDALRTMTAASRQEPGCRAYRFAFDVDDAELVHVFEEWVDADALTAHFATPHMAAFQTAIAGALAAPPELRRYVVASAGPLAG